MSVWNEMKSVLFIAPKEWVPNPLELKMLLDQSFYAVEKREIILIADKKIKPEENENVKWITYFSKADFICRHGFSVNYNPCNPTLPMLGVFNCDVIRGLLVTVG